MVIVTQGTRFAGSVCAFLFALLLGPPAPRLEAGQGVSTGASGSSLTVAEIATRNTRSVVTISTPGGTGSGVILESTGVIVTNLHVLRGETQASVKLANGDVYDDVAVVDVDERRDLLLIKIKAFGLAAAALGDSDRVSVGNRVTLIGSPRGLELTVSDGIVSATRDSGAGYRLFQTNAAASPGSSGGGMFNEAGELIGVVTSKIANGENLNFAVPVNYVKGLLSTQVRMPLSELAAEFPADRPRHQQPAADVVSGANDERLPRLIGASGLEFEKVDDSVWMITYRGDAVPSVHVYAFAAQDRLVIGSIVAESPTLEPSQMAELLSLNFDATLGKVSLDHDNDLVVTSEAELRVVDGPALVKLVHSVALLADKAAGVLQARLSLDVAPGLSAPTGRGLSTLELHTGGASIRYRASEWRREAAGGADEPGVHRHQFRHASGEVWVATISERVEVPIARMLEIGLENARKVDPSVRVVKRGRRTINGLTLVFQELEGTLGGVPFVYYGHYYSDSSGTYQVVGWTARNLFAERRATIESYVSGLQAKVR